MIKRLGLAIAILVVAAPQRVFLQSAPQPAPMTHIVGMGNFSHIVADLDRSVAFYRDGLGFEPTAPARAFEAIPAIQKAANAPGAEVRWVVLKVPGSAMGVELIEYRGVERRPAAPRFHDPGAANLTVGVRDIDATLARLKKAGARVITVAGGPVSIGGRSRNVFLQDPDGFVIELGQPNEPPAPTAETPGNVFRGGFEATIRDTDASVAFYRGLLGFQANVAPAFNDNKVMAETAGAPGAQFRQTRLQVPGTSAAFTLIEFKDIERKTLSTRLPDPGMTMLQLMVRDLDGLLSTLKAGGVTPLSSDGKAVPFGAIRLAVVRDPNNLFLELIERP